MFFTVLIMPTSSDSILYNFSDKLHCSSKSIPCLPCSFNNLSSQSVTVSLLVSSCVGVEEGRCRKSLKEWLHHPHQSIFWIIFKFLRKACKLLSPFAIPCTWELACGVGIIHVVACGWYSLYMHSKQLVHYRCCGQILTGIKEGHLGHLFCSIITV